METTPPLSDLDPSSFSKPELVKVTSIDLNLNVNFDKKILAGTVLLGAQKVDPKANEIILDSMKLNILSIYDVETKQELSYELSQNVKDFGSKLTIQLPKKESNNFQIGIDYETSPDATGLQWLSPSETAGHKHPYLFSQFQPTHARSVIPCQDTPGVKTPYKATISAPQEFTVLMSALQDGSKTLPTGKISHFVQKVPMPSYLIAIAVGVMESRQIGPRTTVWSEKELIEESAYEFANTEHQLKTAEDLCGPYVWGKYDLLVLPPSFPYGGMENPCLTFVTPTLLAGDRSLANVIAHEIAHSWTGNLVTNRNFEHFWLNEGFTVFIERKIKGRLESLQSQDFDAYTHLSVLREEVNRRGKHTSLVVDLKGTHPDEAFSIIPYEKGQTFLRYLESVIGGPAEMEPFLRSYFEQYKYQSIDTDVFKNYFKKYFANKQEIEKIDWQTWLHAPGMPPVVPNYDKTLAIICDEFFDKYNKWDGTGESPITSKEVQKLMASQQIYILQQILEADPQPIDKLKQLDSVFNLDQTKNAELLFLWLRICLKAQWKDKIDAMFRWINTVGRMKYVRPLYRDLFKWEFTRRRAIENFKANRQNMMHVSAFTIAKDLNIEK
ncbi:unnamed protein product [Ceutorhynchus assimilis]|uniref:Peptidase M1 leukotriene A4 hydrolase/aminopeptidase C-terminal domain-containing protein n=1 Tax=Ceutorhynchus assimilis TaxID=467358 RepID=A0A9N9MSW9_9CUCU|nr:unnamed protein product [Ceutorhynchus assimilis]